MAYKDPEVAKAKNRERQRIKRLDPLKMEKDILALKKWRENNPEKIVSQKKQWNKNNPEKIQKYYLKKRAKKYGLTLEEYNKMFEEQGGCCKICKTHQSDLTRSLSIDHCHSSERVRSLLCGNCNVGLGNFKDNIDLLKEAIKYLEENNNE